MGEQPRTLDSLIPVLLRSNKRYDHVAVIAALTMLYKVSVGGGGQRRPITETTQHPMLDLAMLAISNPAMKKISSAGSASEER